MASSVYVSNFRTIDDPFATNESTKAEAINDEGEVVGSFDISGTSYGFTYQNGVFQTVYDPIPDNDVYTTFVGVNDAGEVIGQLLTGAFPTKMAYLLMKTLEAAKGKAPLLAA